MADQGLHHPRSSSKTSPRMYSPHLQPLLQSLLATLTDIYFQYEQLGTDLPNGKPKARVLRMLEERHRERRQPYLQQLAILQEHLYRQRKQDN